MSRKPKSGAFDSYEQDIIQQMRHILQVTTEAERAEHLKIWCSGNHDWVYTICQDRNISAIVFILTALFTTQHPLICQDNETLRYTITGCMVRIMQVVIHEEVVHIPMCTTVEQLEVVHIPSSEHEPHLQMYPTAR